MASPARRASVVMCFDIEPEDRARLPRPDGVVSWRGVEETFEIVEAYRDRLSEATGADVHYAWFLRMDPAIQTLQGNPAWAAERFRPLLDSVQAKGDSIGLHTHAHRWDEQLDDWVVDHGNDAWMRTCLDVAFAAFEDSFGEACTVNRIGDWFMNDHTMAELETRGVLADLTIEPGQRPVPTNTPDHPHTGQLPDYTRAQIEPYRPSRTDFRRPARDAADARRLWELPILAADLRPRTSLTRRALRFARYPGRPPYRLWPLWGEIPGREFWSLVERDLAGRRVPFVAFATRSHTPVMPGGRHALTDKFEALLAHPLVRSVRLETPLEALSSLGLQERPTA